MTDRKVAGHVIEANLSSMFDGCMVLTGTLLKDERGTDRDGMARDFSGLDLRTSWIEELEYNKYTDTTIVSTRNSVYYSPGNLLEDCLDYTDSYFLGGKEEIRAEWDSIPKYKLTEAGIETTGESKYSTVVRNNKFLEHNLCGVGELPFCRIGHMNTEDLSKVFFLKPNEIEEI